MFDKIVKNIKNFLIGETTEEKISSFLQLEKRLDELKIQLIDEVRLKDITTLNFNNQLAVLEKAGEEDFLKGRVNDKFNEFVSAYLIKIGEIKKEWDLIKTKQDKLIADDNFKELIKKAKKITEIEEGKDLAYKKYMSTSLGRKRSTMPQLSKDNFQSFVDHFDDKTTVTKIEMRLKDLKPAQNELDDDKVLDFYQNGVRKDIFIASKDSYIMDGHHNWAAGLEEDEDQLVSVELIGLPINELLRRANIMKLTTKEDINGNKEEIEKALIILSKAVEIGKIGKEEADRILPILKANLVKIRKAELEKARYVNSAENRKKNRVGQEYGGEKKEKTSYSLPVSNQRVKFDGKEMDIYTFKNTHKDLIDYIIFKSKFYGKRFLINNRGEMYQFLKEDKQPKRVKGGMMTNDFEPVRIQLNEESVKAYKKQQEQPKLSFDEPNTYQDDLDKMREYEPD